MKAAVVTGAGGFLGSALVAELRGHGVKVLAISRSRSCLTDDEGVERLTLELSQLGTLASMTEPRWDTFYHLAWEGSAGEKRKNAGLQLRGVQTTVEAVRAAKALGCSMFIGAGSIMEKELLASSAKPGLRPAQGHIYSAAKLAAHHMSECTAAELGIYHIWPIITNAYGEGETSPRLLNTTIRKIIRGEELCFTDGRQNYDFIHVRDAAKALRMLGERGEPFREYVIGSGTARPLREFLLEMQAVLAPEREFIFGDIPFEGISLPLEQFDISPLRRDTGFEPEISFSQGIRQTMNWILNIRQ
ncbi:MAG: NAD(P)-dependent oxidoreductase [Clostridiales bacterium]|jgi:UDP-glucose 4-epimerase|nr:NAD(P)-dependent oxidoreductase [Clostridiales bacterium]